MIAASLAAIAIVGTLLRANQIKLNEESTRAHGVALTRALSSAEYPQADAARSQNELLRTLVSVQGDTSFAYGILVNVDGAKLFESTSQGSIAPPARMPTEPFAWFGEHTVISPGDSRPIREFFAPYIKDGQLAGFFRAGYYEKSAGLSLEQLSSLALLALPIFLLTALSYGLIRREIRPLSQLNEKMERASGAMGTDISFAEDNRNLNDFIQRFDQFISLVQSRVRQMDAQADTAVAATHLLSFKQGKAESALNSMPDAVLVTDDACIPTFVNSKIETMLGVHRGAILGNPPQEWCENKEVLAFLLRFRNGPASMRMARIEYSPHGEEERKISVSAFPLFSPKDQNIIFGTLYVFRDVTQEHLARRAGSEFVSHVSHELKTPLNTLAAYSEMLLDYTSLDEAQRVDAVNVIRSEVKRMSELIHNLLNISKMETGTLSLVRTRVKLPGFLQEIFDRMTHNAMGKGVSLDLQISPDVGSVRLDKDLIRIAMDNLMSNAIKYSNPGGQVTLMAHMQDEDRVKIVVRDNGIGIAAEDCEKVFQKYYRASNSETATRSGHGLGLYLAKQIIELHHGSITLHSEYGKGSEFTITFKAQTAQLEESQAL